MDAVLTDLARQMVAAGWAPPMGTAWLPDAELLKDPATLGTILFALPNPELRRTKDGWWQCEVGDTAPFSQRWGGQGATCAEAIALCWLGWTAAKTQRPSAGEAPGRCGGGPSC